MAYVGTPSYMGGDLNTLASILQGEAGGEGLQGLQAVANVIQNRANQNFSGYGSSPLDQALAHNQFQGQSSNISPEAQQVAQQLLGGKLQDVTGGALYYANPADSSASWARNLNANNALQIGHHFFTNNTNGQPFAPNPYASMADGPKGQEMYQPPMQQPTAVAGSQPSDDNNLGMTAQQGHDVASILDPNQNNFGNRLHAAFQRLMYTPNAPMPYLRGIGDARASGNDLLKALQANGLDLSGLLMKQRLG